MDFDFDKAWETTKQIGGFFERDEAELYWKILNTLPAYAKVVEVGLENGRSTSLPAQFSANLQTLQLHCIDNFSTFGTEGQNRFTETMKAFGIGYTLWQMPSTQAAMIGDRWLVDADLILIDADHDDCETDCRIWIPKLKPGGWILFHDYGRPGWNIAEVVEKYCIDWEGETASSLAARRKPEVTP